MHHQITSVFYFLVTTHRLAFLYIYSKRLWKTGGQLQARWGCKDCQGVFWAQFLHRGPQWFPSDQKTNVAPFSIFAVFCLYQNSFTSIYGNVFLKSFKKAWISNSDYKHYVTFQSFPQSSDRRHCGRYTVTIRVGLWFEEAVWNLSRDVCLYNMREREKITLELLNLFCLPALYMFI